MRVKGEVVGSQEFRALGPFITWNFAWCPSVAIPKLLVLPLAHYFSTCPEIPGGHTFFTHMCLPQFFRNRPTTPQNPPIWADTALKNTKKQAPPEP